MLIKTKGIVFRKLKYSETSIIADIYTESHGLASYIISGVRSAKAKTNASLLELMSIVEMVAYHSDTRKLHRIREIRPAYIYQSIPLDVRKNAILLFMSELCAKTIREAEQNTELFACIETHLRNLDLAKHDTADRHLYFMIALADLLGFGLAANFSEENRGFDLLNGQFVGAPTPHPYYLAEGVRLFHLIRFVRLAEHHGERLGLSRADRNALVDDLLLYFKLHIENMPAMLSHKVLREVL